MTLRRGRNPLAATAAALGLIALSNVSCGSSTPASSTPPVTTPTPQPTPTTPPTGGDSTYYHASCSLGKGDPNPTCGSKNATLRQEVETAMDILIQQHPEIFDLNDEYAPGTAAYRIKDRSAYMDGLVKNLRAAGLCAERDPDDPFQETLRAKSTSDFSEEFDVILSSGYMWRGSGMYRETCSPSSFPVERDADAPPIGSGCGRPYPQPIAQITCKVHIKSPQYYTLDSTPLVGPDVNYCREIGYTDGRAMCPVRPEGAPDRKACEDWRVGVAEDTGRPGPTWWKKEGGYCTGPESGCANHPDTQYQLLAYRSGTYQVQAANGVFCEVTF